MSTVRRSLPRLSPYIKLLGVTMCLTTAVVVGTAAYMIARTELKMDVSGERLINQHGAMLMTARPERAVDTLFEVLQLETDRLRHLQSISFFVSLSDGEMAQLVLKIDRVMRFVSSGRTEICSSGGACILVADDDDPIKMRANYTDLGRHCPTPASCAVILDGEQGQGVRRQLSNVRRQLAWWNPFSWFSSPAAAPPPPVWKATDECPWVCKQGWFWQADAYGKPACCDETKDSGSPYAVCEHDTCMCDASCRSCCTG